ncbi:MAG: VTT domain-containing protein [Caulobacteraceae bacterium]
MARPPVLESLKGSRQGLLAFVHAHPLQSLGLYVAVYVATVALSLPTALILTLTGGFLFGPWIGGTAAAVGCTAGAVIVFLISRLTVGDVVEARTGPRVRALAEEIRKDAFFYILTLRLIPVTPLADQCRRRPDRHSDLHLRRRHPGRHPAGGLDLRRHRFGARRGVRLRPGSVAAHPDHAEHRLAAGRPGRPVGPADPLPAPPRQRGKAA